MVKLLGPFPEQIIRLAFSRDGKYLAATFKNKEGLKVWGAADWAEALADNSYGGSTYGLAFDSSGNIYTASYDGFIRHYSSALEPGAKYSAEAGPKPYSVAINPKNGALAVGFQGQNTVAIFEQPDSAHPAPVRKLQVPEGTLRTAAWSADGESLVGSRRIR